MKSGLAEPEEGEPLPIAVADIFLDGEACLDECNCLVEASLGWMKSCEVVNVDGFPVPIA